MTAPHASRVRAELHKPRTAEAIRQAARDLVVTYGAITAAAILECDVEALRRLLGEPAASGVGS